MIATETVVVLAGGDDPVARLLLEHFAILLCDQARKHGCRATGAWDSGSLNVGIEDGCAESLQQLFQWLGETSAEQGSRVEIGAN